MSRSSGVLFHGEMFLGTCEIQVEFNLSLALRKHQPHASPQNCAGNNKKHKKQSAL
ncbi:hypothetical protein H8S07_08435 [Dorea sp. NSJ-36]|uniref:Uncharacterized protein n=1 Tax=Dorea hominis TaxID=2763040 RepID=A0ABR7EVC6_9FIRM|nr:hypothetical protein [Dorea hominis]MBC5665304.1 hypothetical protein [Dorea hominis]